MALNSLVTTLRLRPYLAPSFRKHRDTYLSATMQPLLRRSVHTFPKHLTSKLVEFM